MFGAAVVICDFLAHLTPGYVECTSNHMQICPVDLCSEGALLCSDLCKQVSLAKCFFL